MANINTNELSKELIAKAMQCETPEELIELAKSEGVEITKEEAEAYLAKLEEVELNSGDLQQVAGGGFNTSKLGDLLDALGKLLQQEGEKIKNG